MRIAHLPVYTFDELSEQAKDNAYHEWLHEGHYDGTDNKKTLKAFEKVFPVTVTDWEYGYHNYIRFTVDADNDIENLSGIKLFKYLYNNYEHILFKGRYYSTPGKYINGKYTYKHRYSKVIKDTCCVLTGYFIDNEILKPIYDFLKNPSKHVTFSGLMRDCLQSWVIACNNDYEASTSMEFFTESYVMLTDTNLRGMVRCGTYRLPVNFTQIQESKVV